MTRFRFIHAADIHLDSPLRGLSQHENFPLEEIRHATRRALENMLSLALEHSVSFVILAGDLYDGAWESVETGFYMNRILSQLAQANIRVFIVSGNHDAQSVIRKELPPPTEVKRLSSRKPETIPLEDLNVVLHGQSFSKRHVTNNLAKHYPLARPGWINIGILHTSLTNNEQDVYAPCSPEDLINTGYDYWALGHIHTQQIINKDPWIVYPGIIQGRHIHETGPCGVMLVEGNSRSITSVTPIACDVIRWESLSLNATGCQCLDDIYALTKSALKKAYDQTDQRSLIVRLNFTGSTPLHEVLCDPTQWHDHIRSLTEHIMIPERFLLVEKIKNFTTPPKNVNYTAFDDLLKDVIDDPEFHTMIQEHFSVFHDRLTSNKDHPFMSGDHGDILKQACAALKHRLMGDHS